MATWASTLFGDKLLSNNGLVDTSSALEGKVVGIYFSAHWCPPCRGFTPDLAKKYTWRKDKIDTQFEIVFVSSDKAQEEFDEYYKEMPWLALPWLENADDPTNRSRKDSLSKKFKVNGIPTLIILNSSGTILTRDGRNALLNEPDLENTTKDSKFPWVPPALTDIIPGNTEFHKNDGSKVKFSDVAGKHLAFYFSAHWCPPCRTFTPKFGKLYEALKKNPASTAVDGFEVVFVSSDKEESAFTDYMSEMPWYALPFSLRETKQKLSTLYSVNGIPALVILGPDHKPINMNARSRADVDIKELERLMLAGKPETFQSDFPYAPKPLVDLDEDPANINDYPVVLFMQWNMPDEEAAPIIAQLKHMGQESLDKAEADGEPDMMFYHAKMAGNDHGSIASQLMSAMEGKYTFPSRPCFMVVNIPEEGEYHVDNEPVSVERLTTLRDEFKEGKLKFSKLQ